MSVRVRGTINIQRKVGRRGDFNIGDLSTEIGTFEVKDALIEQFEPGKYSGEFIIQWIEPDSFSWRGRVFVKNRATLVEMLVDEADEGAPPPTPATPPEPDPIDSVEHRPVPQQPRTTHSAPGATSRTPSGASPATSSADPVAPTPVVHAEGGDAELFGSEIHSLILARNAVKLDPIVDRELFRQQRDRLKVLGYAFNAKSQTWLQKDAPRPESEADRDQMDSDIAF